MSVRLTRTTGTSDRRRRNQQPSVQHADPTANRIKTDLDKLCDEIASGEDAFTLLDVTFDDCCAVVVSMRGPPDSPFEDGTFVLKLRYPTDYPFKPPNVMFLTRTFHPNIRSDGLIDNTILKDDWSPAIDLFRLLLLMRVHLSSTALSSFVVNSAAGAAWREDAATADSVTRAHVARHATREMLPLPTPAAEALQQVLRGQRSPFGRVSYPAATV